MWGTTPNEEDSLENGGRRRGCAWQASGMSPARRCLSARAGSVPPFCGGKVRPLRAGPRNCPKNTGYTLDLLRVPPYSSVDKKQFSTDKKMSLVSLRGPSWTKKQFCSSPRPY